ncbi:MAG: MBL fold metallo-hydrolase [Candidatus Hydrothermarchaeales archaeon]
MVEIFPMMSRSFDSNVYLIIDEVVALIDTGAGLSNGIRREIEDKLDGKDVGIVINTHAHRDHVGGNHLFEDARVLCHELEAVEMRSGNLYGTHIFVGPKSPQRVDELLEEGDEIELGGTALDVIHTPGHTPGSISLLEKTKGLLFSGDTLFPEGSVGRTDLEGGSMGDLIRSLEKLRNYEFETLFPGHMQVVGDAKEHLERALFFLGGF